MAEVIKHHSLNTIREEFNEYILEDGNTLRVKDVLIAFGYSNKIETSPEGKKIAKALFKVKQVNGVLPTGNANVSKLKLVDRPITKNDRQQKLQFEPKKTSLNLYETDDLLIVLRTRLDEIWTTQFKDKDDLPIYSFDSTSALDAPQKKDFAVIKD